MTRGVRKGTSRTLGDKWQVSLDRWNAAGVGFTEPRLSRASCWVSCFAVTALKFLINFEPGDTFSFGTGPTNFVASTRYRHFMDSLKAKCISSGKSVYVFNVNFMTKKTII